MKEHFDRWLSRHPRNQYRRTGREVSGSGNTIFKTYWFKWPDADTFKERLIELLACYADGVIANEDEESCDTIWEAVTGVTREQKALSERMIPASVKAAFDAARQQRMALPGYSENDSWRWGRVDGYACFVNNFAVDGVPNSVTEWSRDRLRQGHDYEGPSDSMTAVRVDVIGRIAKTTNPVLERAIAGLIAPASSPPSGAAVTDEPHAQSRAGTPRALTDRQELEIAKRYREKATVSSLAAQFGVSLPTINKVLIRYTLKKSKKKSPWMG